MGVRALFWAQQQRTPSGVAYAVLMRLAHYANDKGECWPSAATLAADIGFSRSAIFKALSELTACGLVEKVENRFRGNGGRSSTKLRLALPRRQPGVHIVDDERPHGGLPPVHIVDGESSKKEDTPLPPTVDDHMPVRDVLTSAGVSEDRAEEMMAAYAIRFRRGLDTSGAELLADRIEADLDRDGEAKRLIADWQRPDRTSGAGGGAAGLGSDAVATAMPALPAPAPDVRLNDYGSIRVTEERLAAEHLVQLLAMERGRPVNFSLLEQKAISAPQRLIDQARQLAAAEKGRARAPPSDTGE